MVTSTSLRSDAILVIPLTMELLWTDVTDLYLYIASVPVEQRWSDLKTIRVRIMIVLPELN